METRVCVACDHEKPVSGVWYLLTDGPSSFMCGACFYERAENHPVASADDLGGVASV